MRQRLLDATIECVIEYGYAGTTTGKVAERAGVTRGAQVHHFGTKAELVTAAIRHLAAKRTQVALAQLDRIRLTDDLIGAGLDLLWDLHREQVFVATVELWVAARADPELRKHVEAVEHVATASLTETGRVLFPPFAEDPELRHFVYTAMDVIRGILVSGFASSDEARLERRWVRAREHLKLLGEVLLRDVDLSLTGDATPA